WIYAHTGLVNGSVIRGVVGYEYNHSNVSNGASPPDLRTLSSSPQADGGTADSTIYTTSSGAIVVSMGTIAWSWGLDSYSSAYARGHVDYSNAASKQTTTNILNAFLASAPPVTTLTATVASTPTSTGTTAPIATRTLTATSTATGTASPVGT